MSTKIIRKIRVFRNKRVERELPEVVYKSRFLSNLYYLLFNNAFAREHQATLAGRVKHIRETEKIKANYFLLVRNTHRIEKGLLMRPRKDVFGKNYIGETVDSFEGVWNDYQDRSNSQLKWFYDVLSEYFAVAGHDEFIQKKNERFTKIISSDHEKLAIMKKSVPYYRNSNDHSSISYDEFYKLTRQRRSVRWFLDKPVDRELIDKAILAANQSPSACNRQPFEFRVFDDRPLVQEVVNYPMGTQGILILYPC